MKIIAILGRPNAGKSTLFNRIIRKRKAIVRDTPGVTRDRNVEITENKNRRFLLVDTGGIEPTTTSELKTRKDKHIFSGVQDQIQLAVDEADLVWFLLDRKDGLTPGDEVIARSLHHSGKPVFAVVNKVDHPSHEPDIGQYYSLGIDPVFNVSAEHGRGVQELLDASLEDVIPEPDEDSPEEDGPIRIAVVGKPNVGKSSLVNRLLGEDRMIVSPTPHTTRDAVDSLLTHNDKEYILVDTAGIRRKGRTTELTEHYAVIQSLKAIERCQVALVLIDALEGLTEQDMRIAGYTQDEGKPAILLFNKWDVKEKETTTYDKMVKRLRENMPFFTYASIRAISALSGLRVDTVFPLIHTCFEQWNRRLPTGQLNRFFREVIHKGRISSYRGRQVKYYYMTQPRVRPPTFLFFVNDPALVHFSFRRYIANKIRDEYEFAGTPIRLSFRKR